MSDEHTRYNINNFEIELAELCKLIIEILNEAKQNGLISEFEYIKHAQKKKIFLEQTLNYFEN